MKAKDVGTFHSSPAT